MAQLRFSLFGAQSDRELFVCRFIWLAHRVIASCCDCIPITVVVSMHGLSRPHVILRAALVSHKAQRGRANGTLSGWIDAEHHIGSRCTI